MTDERPAKTVNVEAARKLLENALDGTRPRSEKTTKTAILLELKPQILKLRQQKYSWAEIADLLKSTGVGNKDTIRYAMEAGTTKKKRATPAKRSSTVSTPPRVTRAEPANGTQIADAAQPKKPPVDPSDYAKTRL